MKVKQAQNARSEIVEEIRGWSSEKSQPDKARPVRWAQTQASVFPESRLPRKAAIVWV